MDAYSLNKQLMQEADNLNLTYNQLYENMQNIFPLTDKEYTGSIANHFRGKLVKNKSVKDFIGQLCNNSLTKIIVFFS